MKDNEENVQQIQIRLKEIEQEIQTKLKELQDTLRPYQNTLVLIYENMVLLKDVVFDKEDDHFDWVISYNGDKIVHHSCVAKFIPLMGYISNEDYDYLVRVWNLNNKNKAKAFEFSKIQHLLKFDRDLGEE